MEKRLMIRNLSIALCACAVLGLGLPAAAQGRRGLEAGNTTNMLLPLSSSSKKLNNQPKRQAKSRSGQSAQKANDDNPKMRWQNGINPIELSQLIQEQHQTVRRCYESQLKRTPKLQGTMDVRFKITHWGRVGKTKITDNSLGNTRVRRCVVKAIRKWRFPFTRKGGVTVELPLLFKPHNTKTPLPEVHTAHSPQLSIKPGA